MLYRKMPKVKEDLSILGFGCMRFPIIDDDASKIDEAGPCPHGVNIPQCFAYYNDYFRFNSLKAKGNAKIMYNSILSKQQKASSCVECGNCEEHCPQGIQIIKELKNVSQEFGN